MGASCCIELSKNYIMLLNKSGEVLVGQYFDVFVFDLFLLLCGDVLMFLLWDLCGELGPRLF